MSDIEVTTSDRSYIKIKVDESASSYTAKDTLYKWYTKYMQEGYSFKEAKADLLICTTDEKKHKVLESATMACSATICNVKGEHFDGGYTIQFSCLLCEGKKILGYACAHNIIHYFNNSAQEGISNINVYTVGVPELLADCPYELIKVLQDTLENHVTDIEYVERIDEDE